MATRLGRAMFDVVTILLLLASAAGLWAAGYVGGLARGYVRRLIQAA